MLSLLVELPRRLGGEVDHEGSSQGEWALDRLAHGGRGLAVPHVPSVQLDVRLGAAGQQAGEGAEEHPGPAV
jgi:hypothetical protein